MPSSLLKTLLLLVITVLPATAAPAQDIQPKTQVYIIGLRHTGNKKFNHKTLFRKLKTLQPDLVLWEQSTGFKRYTGLIPAAFLGLVKPGVEQLALQKYTRYSRKCRVLPFDTLIEDRRKYIKENIEKGDRVFALLGEKSDNRTMEAADSLALAAYWRLRNEYYYNMLWAELEKMNEVALTETTRELNRLDNQLIGPLVTKYISDTALVNWYHNANRYWDLRNQYMCKQIAAAAVAHSGKKIVVLTGFNHKYYLLRCLREMKNTGLEIVEWEKMRP